MNQLNRIAPITDLEAQGLVQPGTHASLADQITQSTDQPDAVGVGQARRGSRARHSSVRRRRWMIGVPVAAGLAAVALIATTLGRPGQHVGPVSVGPAAAQAQALSFTRHGRYIDVIVRNPLADQAKYRAEFARYHLDVTLRFVPASPSIVGTVVYFSETQGAPTIKTITARGRCHTGGGGAACPVGLRVPVHFSGQAQLVFGRAARPGEKYDSTASAFAPGEVMHGMNVHGQTVAQVLAALAGPHVTVPVFNYNDKGNGKLRSSVPGTWYVYDAVPWAQGQVMLFVGPTVEQHVVSGQPANGKPAPSASPTSAS